jgi:hypothetical protein
MRSGSRCGDSRSGRGNRTGSSMCQQGCQDQECGDQQDGENRQDPANVLFTHDVYVPSPREAVQAVKQVPTISVNIFFV